MYDPKHIYIISPSGYTQVSALEKAKIRLESLGFKVTLDPAATAVFQRFAGSDSERVAAFHRAAEHPAGIVLASRGGYGLTRLLPLLDWNKIVQSTINGKRYVGYSDFTAFNLALLAAGGSSYTGLAASGDFGGETVDELSQDIFLEVMGDLLEIISFESPNPPEIDATGVLWGGNLSMLVGMIGTPYFPKVEQGILILEDVGESPYRVERMLTQLLYSGIVDQQQAVIFGDFTEYKLFENDNGFDLPVVFDWFASQTKTPVIRGLPYGHTAKRFTLPIGRTVGVASENDLVHLVLQLDSHDHEHDDRCSEHCDCH